MGHVEKVRLAVPFIGFILTLPLDPIDMNFSGEDPAITQWDVLKKVPNGAGFWVRS